MSTPGETPQLSLSQLLKAMIEKGASDLHITAGSPPLLRIDDQLVPLRLPPLNIVDTQRLCFSVLTEEQKQHFEKHNEVDLAFSVKNLARFRANVFMQRGSVAGAFRAIPFRILTFDELGLPPVIADLASRPRGLVLVTGPTGSGKSTTLAAIIDKINSENRSHIVTVEDPIEFLHPHRLSVVNQREVGADAPSFKEALRGVLRQDPDVVMIGEMRDPDTIEAAITIAETGHLVLATLHTNSAVLALARIIDSVPGHARSQIRAQLSYVLQGVITQLLLPRDGGPGRVLAMEVLIPNAAIRNLMREDKIHQIYSLMQTGQSGSGMQTMNQSLATLCARKLIGYEEAINRSADPDELRALLDQLQVAATRPARH